MLVLAGAVVGAVTAASLRSGGAARSPGTVRVATAPVLRTGLTDTTQLTGSLGYAGSYGITNQLPGTAYTALPRAGQVVRRGQELYEVDGAPVFLFYGRRPQWRALAIGMTAGPDVAQLDANLIALGYASPAALTVSDDFTGATAAAVGRWQAATGQLVTGAVALGQLAYTPGPVRVAEVAAGLGGTPQPGGPVLTATSVTHVVQVPLPVSQEYLVRRGDRVTVTLPDGTTTTPGVITSVAAAIATASGGSSAAGSDSPPGQPPPGPSAGSGSGGPQATVAVIVRLTQPRAAGHLDAAPVTVNIVSAQARNVLAVPVSALVALGGGGYAVQLVRDGFSQLVAVRTGLFTSTLVQVTGTGLSPGALVQVPAP